jgi:hypothetical protein
MRIILTLVVLASLSACTYGPLRGAPVHLNLQPATLDSAQANAYNTVLGFGYGSVGVNDLHGRQ